MCSKTFVYEIEPQIKNSLIISFSKQYFKTGKFLWVSLASHVSSVLADSDLVQEDSKMRELISRRKIEFSLASLALALVGWPLFEFWRKDGYSEVRFSLFVIAGLIICVIAFPGFLSSISSKGHVRFAFSGVPYYENYDNRVSAFIRAIRKLAVLWILAVFAIISHYHMSKLTWDRKCMGRSDIPEICKFKHYHEKEYLQEKEQFLATMVLAAIASILTAYWNLDAIYGRRWQYLCGLYKDFILVDEGKTRKKEVLRINLCIDILDHSMWNSKQFSIFLKFELEKYYWALLQSESFKTWLKERNYAGTEYFQCTQIFMKEFKEQVIDRQRDGSSKAPIKMEFNNLRKALSLVSAYVEEPQNSVWQLDRYPGVRALPQAALEIKGSVFDTEKYG